MAYGNYIFIIGGRDVEIADVALANGDGTVGPWSHVTRIPSSELTVFAHTALIDNGYLYVIGGWELTPFGSFDLLNEVRSARLQF